MTGSQHLFTSFVLCNASHSIKIANGSLLNIYGTSTIVLSPQPCLTNMFFMSLDSYVIYYLLVNSL